MAVGHVESSVTSAEAPVSKAKEKLLRPGMWHCSLIRVPCLHEAEPRGNDT